ncbi:MAG: SDR family oxidoreductase [Actinobacteria bacterium]|nr:SDR family oxidoreductase [Actinomycetota bacterium]MBU1492357.1 SDR family oxidoreductase [Actinomycetota bacterium]MBU1865815.1 SDR family oxidoreductase [Actinomycetota bacterium]
MELSGTTALVTGGAHRVGRGIALALAEAGCDLVLHYRSSAGAARETADEIEAMGRRVALVGADLSEPSAAAAIVAGAGELAPVRVLVNSAAVFATDSLTGVTPEGWRQTLDVNLTGPVFLTQAFAAALPADLGGAVVNVTDWRTARPYSDHFSYIVAKGAINTFTAAAAEHLAPRIRVNAVALGAILPPPGRDSAYLKALAKEIPLRRVGDPGLVAATVLHLLGNDFITGEIVRIDGGAHLR